METLELCRELPPPPPAGTPPLLLRHPAEESVNMSVMDILTPDSLFLSHPPVSAVTCKREPDHVSLGHLVRPLQRLGL